MRDERCDKCLEEAEPSGRSCQGAKPLGILLDAPACTHHPLVALLPLAPPPLTPFTVRARWPTCWRAPASHAPTPTTLCSRARCAGAWYRRWCRLRSQPPLECAFLLPSTCYFCGQFVPSPTQPCGASWLVLKTIAATTSVSHDNAPLPPMSADHAHEQHEG